MLSSSEFDDADQVREGVFDRRLHLCPRLQSFDTNDLVLSCSKCNQFLLYCCHCSKKFPTRRKGKPCHHYRLVFTDGACRNNGQVGATAGIGIAHGRDEESQLSIPITTEVDSYSRRTSQRAELIAAIEGLSTVCQYDYDLPDHDDPDDSDKIALIVATDSEYVVKGMTEWLPQWKANNWRNARNSSPSNLDLFQKLDTLVTEESARHGIEIGFWHVERAYNVLADGLAKAAAVDGDPA